MHVRFLRSRRRRALLPLSLAAATAMVGATLPLTATAAHAETPGDTGPESTGNFDATWGGDPEYDEQMIAQNGGEYPITRIPALTVTNSGTILASYDGRPGAADAPAANSIVQKRSTDNGKTWSETETVHAGHEGDDEEGDDKEGYSDPSYIVDRETGDIFNFHVHSMDEGFVGSQPGTDPDDRDVIHAEVSVSHDNGVNWEHHDITPDITPQEDWRTRFAASGQGIQLQYGKYAGRLIQQYTIISDKGQQTVSVYSDDHGKTWQAGEPVGTGMDENKTVELSDGTVMLNSRPSDGSGHRKVAYSHDGGVTYENLHTDSELPDPANNGSIVRAFPNAPEGSDDAKVLLFSNAASTSSRSHGTVRMSCDDGETWPVAKTFREGGMSYSTLATLPDGNVGLLYEPGGSNIEFASFNLVWLGGICAGIDVDDVTADAGSQASVPVTVNNTSGNELTGANVSLDFPDGWESKKADVPNIAAGDEASVEVPVSIPEDAVAGGRTVTATLTTDQGKATGTFTVTVAADDDAVITVVPSNASDAQDEYVAGDTLDYEYRVKNISDQTVSVEPESDDLDGIRDCRYQNLEPGESYSCAKPSHSVTDDDLTAGEFAPTSTWTALDGDYEGDEIATLERTGPTTKLPTPEHLIPQSDLSIAGVSSVHEGSPGTNALDGDADSIWHTNWDLNDPGTRHWITLDLGDTYDVDALRYLPRQSGNNGMLKDYEAYVTDSAPWTEDAADEDADDAESPAATGAGPAALTADAPQADAAAEDDADASLPDDDPAASGTLKESHDAQTIALDGTEGRYVTLVFDSSYSDAGKHYGSAAELNVQGVASDASGGGNADGDDDSQDGTGDQDGTGNQDSTGGQDSGDASGDAEGAGDSDQSGASTDASQNAADQRDELPWTGAQIAPALGVALAAIVLGGIALLIGLRRRTTHTE